MSNHAPRATPATSPGEPARSDQSVIAYLAFLGVLLATGIDIALPAFGDIERALPGASSTSLMVTAYLLGMAIGQLVAGPCADTFGRQRVIQAGLVLYLVGAIGAALAPSFGALLFARAVWGIGAAAPAGLRTAIARDLYSGDKMARITTIVMAVFLLGPVFIPLVGEVLLSFASWQIVFWFSALIAIGGLVWSQRFGETLPPEHRRQLQVAPIAQACVAVVKTRVTAGLILSNTLFSGAFFIFLGSTQPIFERIYGREDQFAWLFALAGLLTIPGLAAMHFLIGRFGAIRMVRMTATIAVAVTIAGVVIFRAADGIPDFWTWYLWLVIAAATLTLTAPALQAIALEPMGTQAGTASSLLNFASFAGGAGLAAIFDAQIDGTVTPMAIGFALYNAIGLAIMMWSLRGAKPSHAQ